MPFHSPSLLPHGPVALPGLAQGICRKFLHFYIPIPACKGFDQSINSLIFHLATQSSRGSSTSAAQMDGTSWNICASQTQGVKRSLRQHPTLWEHPSLTCTRSQLLCSHTCPARCWTTAIQAIRKTFLKSICLKRRQEDKNW